MAYRLHYKRSTRIFSLLFLVLGTEARVSHVPGHHPITGLLHQSLFLPFTLKKGLISDPYRP